MVIAAESPYDRNDISADKPDIKRRKVMADVVIIDRVEDDDYQGKAFKKVTDKTGKTFKVKYGRGGALKAKWPLLVPGTAIEIEWGDYEGKPFVKDFKVVVGAEEVALLSPAPEAVAENTTPPPAPQAVGMMTNNICQLIIANKISTVFGERVGIELVKWYRSQVFGITRINYDGKDLPAFK